MEWNKSAIFMSQMFEFDKAPVQVFDDQHLVNSYLVDPSTDGDAYQGRFYLVFRASMPSSLTDYLVSHPAFLTMYCPKDGLIVFSFDQSAYADDTVRPFLEGAYSKVSREYVEKHFPNVQTHRRYGSRQVFDRHPAHKAEWEAKIGVTLPDDAEVWSKPIIGNETITLEVVPTTPQA